MLLIRLGKISRYEVRVVKGYVYQLGLVLSRRLRLLRFFGALDSRDLLLSQVLLPNVNRSFGLIMHKSTAFFVYTV